MIAQLNTENKTLLENVEKLSSDRKGFLIQMKKMTEQKEKLEEKMLNNFLPILHTKQVKICELETQLNSRLVKPKIFENLDCNEAGKNGSVVHSISSSDNDDEVESKFQESLNLDDSQNMLKL